MIITQFTIPAAQLESYAPKIVTLDYQIVPLPKKEEECLETYTVETSY
ncbi:hypothetical protein [Enterococcus bulliens]